MILTFRISRKNLDQYVQSNTAMNSTIVEYIEGIKAFGRAELSGYDVALKHVRFSYSGQRADEVLHGIDLTLPQGSFTALVGPSGGGKSTAAKLIARFWDVTGGGNLHRPGDSDRRAHHHPGRGHRQHRPGK